MNLVLLLLTVVVALTSAVHCASSAEDNDSSSGENDGNHRRGGDDDSSEEDDDDIPHRWIDLLHPKQHVLSLAYADQHVVIYLDKGCNRSANWPFELISKAWRYVKSVYGALARGEDSRLWLKIHSWSVQPIVLPSRSNDGRNVIDVTANERNAVGVVIEQMSRLIESAAHSVNFTRLLVNVARPWPIVAFDIHRNVTSIKAAEWKKLINLSATDENAFDRWFCPIYRNYAGSAVICRFFRLVSENINKIQNRALTWAEFSHFWGGVTKVDVKLLLTSAFQIVLDEKEIKKSKSDFGNVSYCSDD